MKINSNKELLELLVNSISDEPSLVEEFLNLADVKFSSDVTSLAVRVDSDKIYLLVNKDFVEKYCETEKHLTFLFYHELYHLYLGHLIVFNELKDNTHKYILNLAFDALINAALVKKFNNVEYTSILYKIYDAKTVPECILRPPDDPNVETNFAIPIVYRWIIQQLYNSKDGLSVFQLVDILKDKLKFVNLKILLGTHPVKDIKKYQNKIVYQQHNSVDLPSTDKLLCKILNKITNVDGYQTFYSDPTPECEDDRILKIQIKLLKYYHKEVVLLIRKAINKLLTEDHTKTRYNLFCQETYDTKTVIPDFSKNSYILRQESNLDVIFYDTTQTKEMFTNPEVYCNVYVDVSGSISEYYHILYSSLRPFVKRNLVKIYLWSTKVKFISPEELLTGKIYTTGGTKFDCAVEHMLKHNVKKALVLTDGFFYPPDKNLIKKIKQRKVIIDFILTPVKHFIEAMHRKSLKMDEYVRYKYYLPHLS